MQPSLLLPLPLHKLLYHFLIVHPFFHFMYSTQVAHLTYSTFKKKEKSRTFLFSVFCILLDNVIYIDKGTFLWMSDHQHVNRESVKNLLLFSLTLYVWDHSNHCHQEL